MSSNKRSPALRVAFTGITAALAIALSFFESLLPPMPFLPPGAKPGFANIAVMFAILALSWTDGVFVMLVKSGFVFLTRGAAAFFMSISGGVLSITVTVLMIFLMKKLGKSFSYIGISVFGAVFHNIGQLIAAGLYTGSAAVVGYLPMLLIFGVCAGAVTGVILRVVMPRLMKLTDKIK